MNPASRPDPAPLAESGHVVLIVEDEPVLRASMVRGLSKLSGVEVFDAGTVRDALELLRAYPPTLVISDLDLPDGSGVEVAAALERQGRSVPIVFVTAYLNRFRARLPDRPGVEVHEKPMPLERLRQVVVSKLGAAEGEAHPFGVLDYVQLAGMGRRSIVLEVRGHLSGVGRVVVRQGEMWAASDERGEGIDAFRRMAFLSNASVSCRAPAEAEQFPRNVQGSCENVLLEVARQHDESRRDAASWHPSSDGSGQGMPDPLALKSALRPGAKAVSESGPRRKLTEEDLEAGWDEVAPASAPPRSRPKPSEPSFAELYERGVDALLAKKHAEAYMHFDAASRIQPDEPNVVANLNRLRTMGHGS
jgi:CheY-like chemotaxis protein